MERKFLYISSWKEKEEREEEKFCRWDLVASEYKFLKIDKSSLRILYEDRGKRAKDGEDPF